MSEVTPGPGPRPVVESGSVRTDRIIAERNEQQIEAERRMSLFIERATPENDRAELEIYGSRGREYVDPSTGALIADKDHPKKGILDEIRENRKYGKTEADREAAASAYESDINSLLGDGFELAQAKLIMDLREKDQEEIGKLTGRYMSKEGGSLPAGEAADKARSLYTRYDTKRLDEIRQSGALSVEDYEKARNGEDLYAKENASRSPASVGPEAQKVKYEQDTIDDQLYEAIDNLALISAEKRGGHLGNFKGGKLKAFLLGINFKKNQELMKAESSAMDAYDAAVQRKLKSHVDRAQNVEGKDRATIVKEVRDLRLEYMTDRDNTALELEMMAAQGIDLSQVADVVKVGYKHTREIRGKIIAELSKGGSLDQAKLDALKQEFLDAEKGTADRYHGLIESAKNPDKKTQRRIKYAEKMTRYGKFKQFARVAAPIFATAAAAGVVVGATGGLAMLPWGFAAATGVGYAGKKRGQHLAGVINRHAVASEAVQDQRQQQAKAYQDAFKARFAGLGNSDDLIGISESITVKKANEAIVDENNKRRTRISWVAGAAAAAGFGVGNFAGSTYLHDRFFDLISQGGNADPTATNGADMGDFKNDFERQPPEMPTDNADMGDFKDVIDRTPADGLNGSTNVDVPDLDWDQWPSYIAREAMNRAFGEGAAMLNPMDYVDRGIDAVNSLGGDYSLVRVGGVDQVFLNGHPMDVAQQAAFNQELFKAITSGAVH